VMLAVGAVLVLALFRNAPAPAGEAGRARFDAGALLAAAGRPAVRLGVVNLVVGQAVMVMLMTLFPIHALHHGQPLGTINAIITAHVAGMFALAWLTGGLVDRFGAWRVSGAGAALLGAGAVASALSTPALDRESVV